MAQAIEFRPTVVRTDRGLSIAGTRITLYQIMDYLKDNEPPEVIRDHFRLTIKQTDDVMEYIEIHYDEVEKAENLPIGSGVTEAGCKVIVKERLCRSGMRWKEQGASVVLTLRYLNYTDERWEKFWNKIDRYGFNLAV